MTGQSAFEHARERIRATGERMTAPRIKVLATLLGAGSALSHHEIERTLGSARPDKVTLYRVLEWMVDRRLAHRIAGADRVWRFSVAQEAHEQHAHFQCSRCGKVLCLDELSARKVSLHLPRGCHPERIEVTVTGACAECTA